MAGKKVAEITIPINLTVDDSDVGKKVQQAYKEVQSTVEKNKIKFQLDIDKNGVQQFSKFIGEIKETGKNVLINLDEEAFLKQVKSLKIKSKKEFEQIKEVFQNIVKTSSSDSSNSLMAKNILQDLGKYDSMISKVEEYVSKIKDLQNQLNKFNETALKNAFINYNKNDGNKNSAKEFIGAFENYNLTSNNKDIKFDQIRGNRKTTVDYGKLSTIYNDLLDEFNFSDKEINNVISNLEKKSAKIKESIDKYENQIKNINVDDQKEVKDDGADKYQGSDYKNINITPANLDEFYNKIENYKVAEINADIKNKEKLFEGLENKKIDVPINPIFEKNTDISNLNIRDIQRKMLEIYSKASKNGFSNTDFQNLDILLKEYTNRTGKNVNVGNILNKYNIDKNEYIEQFREAKKSFENISDEISLDVKIDVDDSQISNLKQKIEQGVNPIDVQIGNVNNTSDDLKNQTAGYEEIKNQLVEIASLQEKVSLGNKDIAKTSSSSGQIVNSLIDKKDIRKGSTTKTSISRLIDEYNNSDTSNEGVKTKLSAYVASYKSLEDAQKIFGESNKSLWNEIIASIQKANEAQQAYLSLQEKSKSLLDNASSLSGKELTDKSYNEFSKLLDGDIDSASKYLKDNFDIDLSSVQTGLSSGIKNADNAIEQLKTSINEIKNTGLKPIDVVFNPKVDTVDAEIKRIKGLSPINLDVNIKSINNNEGNNIDSSIDDLRVNILDIGTAYESVDNIIMESSIKQTSMIDTVISSIKELKSELNSIGLNNLSDVNNANRNSSNKTYEVSEKRLTALKNNLDKYDIDASQLINIDVSTANGIENIRVAYEKLQTSASETYKKISDGNFSSKAEADQLINSLNNQISKLKELSNVNNLIENKKGSYLGDLILGDKSLSDLTASDIKDKVNEVLKKSFGDGAIFENTRYFPDRNKITTDVIQEGTVTKVTASLREYTDALGNAQVQVRALTGEEKEYQTAGQKWISGLKSKVNSLTQYITGLELVMRGWQEVKEGFNFVKELDSTLTTIYQTMDITKQGLAELGTGAIQMGKDLGTAGNQVMDSVDIYAAYGETVDSILSKASPTVMLANAAQGDVRTASEQIQAVIQQYKELEGQETRVVNAYEKIAANVQIDFPRGVNTIAEAVQTAGSVASDAGLSFENFSASVAKVAERTRLEG